MKHDYRETWRKRDMQPDEDEGLSFKYIAKVCLLFAGIALMAIIGLNF